MMPVISPPVLKRSRCGNALAKSLAGETTLAAMLTASVATTDGEHRDRDDDRRRWNWPTSWTGSQIDSP